MLRLTGESSRGRDEIDCAFEEIQEFMVEEDIEIEQHSDMHSERSSRTPFDDDESHPSDDDYVEEATESLDENDDDEFEQIVTRGRAKRKTTKAKVDKKQKPKNSPVTRQNRTTRAASVRF